MNITLRERPGRCRWCGCTELKACGAGCSWANRAATLCSACVPVDTMIRTVAGRKQLAEAANLAKILDAGLVAAAARPRRRARARRARARR